MLAYIPFPKEVPVNADTLFAIEGELNSKVKLNIHIDENGDTLREHDLPDRFQYGPYIWQNHIANTIWFLKPSSQTADYTLRIRPSTHQAEFSLSTPTKTLWKAPAVIAEDYPHFSSGIYPDYDSSLRNLFENYDSLSKDQKDQAPLPDHYPSELASLSCPITSGIKVKSVSDVFKWQNTFMWLQRNSESDPQIQHYQSFCSPRYAILLPPVTNLYTGYTDESGENSTVKVEALLFSLPDMRFITSVYTPVPKPTENKMFTVKYLKIEPQAHRHVATGEIMEYTFDFEPIVLEENK